VLPSVGATVCRERVLDLSRLKYYSPPPPGATQPIVGVYFTALYRALASSRTRLLDHTQRRATVGRTPLNERSVRHRDLYLTTHNTHNRQTSMTRVGFEPTTTEILYIYITHLAANS
jgi:hypothetical protein